MTLLFRAFIFPALLLGVSVAWASDTVPRVDAAPDRLKAIQAVRELRVCIWPDYYGISYRNRKTLGLEGIDIDLARQLGQDLGVAVAFVDSSFATLAVDVGANRCDVAMFAIGYTPQRAQALRYTTPHLHSDIYAITTKANRRIQDWADIDQPGVVVAVAKGTYHEPVLRARLKAATLLVVDTPQAREQEVAAGRADVFMTDYPFSRRMLDNVDWARLIAPPSTYHLTPYAWVVKPGDNAWFNRLQAFVQAIKADGRLLAAAKRHRLEPIVNLQGGAPPAAAAP